MINRLENGHLSLKKGTNIFITAHFVKEIETVGINKDYRIYIDPS